MLALAALGAPLAAQSIADLPRPRTAPVLQFASTDPSGGNEDSGHCLRVLADGTCVLAEVVGPGRMVRLWSANPEGTLRVEADGVVVHEGPFGALATGGAPPFVPPLTVDYAGGLISHAPIPFHRHLRITATPVPGRYHQITVLGGEAAAAAGDAALLVADPTPPTTWSSVPGAMATTSTTLCTLPGPAEAVVLRGAATGSVRGLWLEAVADGAEPPAFAAPWDLLFPTLPATALTAPADGAATLRLPLPCRRSLAFRLRRDAGVEPVPGPVDFAVGWRRLPADHDRLYLHAAATTTVAVHGQPIPVLHRNGTRGHLVGIVAAMDGAPAQGLSFLEGDEAIALDDLDPLRGTGTEDFFAGAWYFRGAPAGSRFHAVTVQTQPPRVLASRFLVGDALPFARRIAFDLEHGGQDDAAGAVYRTLAFWYDDDAAGLPAPPPVAVPPAVHASTLPASDLWPRLAPGGGAVRLPGGRVPLPPMAAPLRLQLLADGAPVGPAIDLASGADAFDLAADATVTHVRREPLLPAIRDWLVCGPYPCAQRRGLDRTWPPEQTPRPAGLEWQEVHADAAGLVDLWTHFPREGAVAAARVVLRAEREQDAVLWLGSDDAVRVRLGGKVVHEHRGVRGASRDQDRVPIHLAAGEQELLLLVENYRGGFGLMARLDGATGVTSSLPH